MTDLTVLVSPTPLYPAPKSSFAFGGRRTPSPVSRSVMVTLESEADPDPVSQSPFPPSGLLSSSPPQDSSLLSPPINTWKSRPHPTRPRHRPTRSQSAPPERTTFLIAGEPQTRAFDDITRSAGGIIPLRSTPKRSLTSYTPPTTTKGGELVRPPPPLLRPTTFWRKTRRSGVTGASYSPSSHLIRRSTFIAAGLSFDQPIHDLSAFCVESRVGCILLPPDQKFQ